jgi:DNA-binding NtrC family response regulator
MATRKTTFEVVPLADIAPLLKDAEVLGAAEETEFEAPPQPAKILSVTYDLSLATTREMLFSSAGFQVTSVLTVGQAIQRCAAEEFALVVVGHSIPLDQRKWLLKEVRGRCATPVLALRRAGEPPLTEADYTFDSTESPALLLETVVNILRPKARSAITGRRNGVTGLHDAKEAQRHQ